MARIAEKLKNPIVERLDLTRHYITFDCDFACYMVLNPSSADRLEGSDVVGIPIGSWQVDAWSFLTKDHYPNRAGFSAVFVYDAEKVCPPDTETPSVRYSDIDIAHAVSGLRGQPVNITQFTCQEAMPVQITTPDKEPLTVSTSGIMYSPSSTFGHKKDVLSVQGLSSELSVEEKGVFSSYLSDVNNAAYEVDLARLSLNARFGKELLRLYPSGVGSLVTLSDGVPSACIPFTPNRLVLEYGYDVEAKAEKEKAVSDAQELVSKFEADLESGRAGLENDKAALSAAGADYAAAVSDNVAYLEYGTIPPSKLEAIKRAVWSAWGSRSNWQMPTVPNCVQFRVPANGETLAGRDGEIWDFMSKFFTFDVSTDMAIREGLYKDKSANVCPISPYKLVFQSDGKGCLGLWYVSANGGVCGAYTYRTSADGEEISVPCQSVSFEDFDKALTLLGAWTSTGFNADWWNRWIDNNIMENHWERASGPCKEYWTGLQGVGPALEADVSETESALQGIENKVSEDLAAIEDTEKFLADAEKAVPLREAELADYLGDEESIILLRFVLVYCFPYTAFKKDPTGASRVLCWRFFHNASGSADADFSGSIQ